MRSYSAAGVALLLGCSVAGFADDKLQDVQERLSNGVQVLDTLTSAPDTSVSKSLLNDAECVVVVPGLKKGAFIVGAQYGKGFATCRRPDGKGWTNPAAIKVEGGSVGFQIGGQENDVVMFIMNKDGMRKLEQSKFTLGADASVAAGPVGRVTAAQTDAYMRAQILTWSRSRGLFAGVALNGATLRPDKDDNAVLYGKPLDTAQVFHSNLPPPAAARPLLAELNRLSPTVSATTGQRPAAGKASRQQRK